jgi:DNA polymerase-4
VSARATPEGADGVFHRFTSLVEPLALDEAYLDVTDHALRHGTTATAVARAIKASVRQELGLTVSAGVSNCKFVAKVASGWKKPDGLTVIPPDQVPAFVAALPIERFHSVGPATAAKLREMGVHAGADLLAFAEEELVCRFGKFGSRLHQLARGIDERLVEPNRARKSVGAERTFDTDVFGSEALAAALETVIEGLTQRLSRAGAPPWCTLKLKIRTNDFRTMTRSRSFETPLGTDPALLCEAAMALLHAPALPDRPVRLLGLTVSSFAAAHAHVHQLTLPLNRLRTTASPA